jgi:hypothetical protein
VKENDKFGGNLFNVTHVLNIFKFYFIEFLSTIVSQAAIVLQQPSEHSTGQEFRILVPSSTLTAVARQLLPAKQWLTETRRVSTVK